MPNASTADTRKADLVKSLSFYESELPRLTQLYRDAATPTSRKGWYETLYEWRQRMQELRKEIAQLEA